MDLFNVNIFFEMPNSFDDLIKLSQQFEKLDQCGQMDKSEQYGFGTSDTPKITSQPKSYPSILKNKAKSADAATIKKLRSTLRDNNKNTDVEIDVEDIDDVDIAKTVKFADDSQLVEIRKFVPSTENMDLWASCDYYKKTRPSTPKTSFSLHTFKKPPELAICFKDPYLEPDFLEKFASRNVALDRCGARERVVTGVVLVKNIEYHKEVFIRYTLDKWNTIHHTDAVYIPNSSDGDTDRFTFSILFPKCCEEMEFAVCYKLSRGEFWDSNDGKNFKVQDILYSSKNREYPAP